MADCDHKWEAFTGVDKCARCGVRRPDLPEDRMRALADAAAEQSGSGRWIRERKRSDGTARVYGPCRGPLRVIVPVAETSAECGALIAYAASPDRVRALAAVVEAARSLDQFASYQAMERAANAILAALAALDGLNKKEGE